MCLWELFDTPHKTKLTFNLFCNKNSTIGSKFGHVADNQMEILNLNYTIPKPHHIWVVGSQACFHIEL
jgi:hypothetical protein